MTGTWKYSTDATEAVSALTHARVMASATALERAVARLAAMMESSARGAFDAAKEPRTGRAWESPAVATQADPRFRSLLRRTGTLEQSLRGQYRVGHAVATAGLAFVAPNGVIRYGMIHLYGVKSGARRRARKRSVALPPRRFVGFPKAAYAAIIDRLKRDLVGEP